MRSPARCVARRGNWRAALRRARQRRDVQRVARGFRFLLAMEQQGTAPFLSPAAAGLHARRDREKKLTPPTMEVAVEAAADLPLLLVLAGASSPSPPLCAERPVFIVKAVLREKKRQGWC